MTNTQLKVREKVGRLGAGLDEVNPHTAHLNPVEGVGYGFSQTGNALDATFNVLRRLLTGKDGLDKLSGPLGIFTVADAGTDANMKQEGVAYDQRLWGAALWLIQLSALLSIGVGFFNLLPIPVLDGGAAVMCIAEAVTGREVPEKVQRVGLTIGLAMSGELCSGHHVAGHNAPCPVVGRTLNVNSPPLEILSGMLS